MLVSSAAKTVKFPFGRVNHKKIRLRNCKHKGLKQFVMISDYSLINLIKMLSFEHTFIIRVSLKVSTSGKLLLFIN